MTAILGFTELLMLDETPEDERQNYLEVIHENGQSLLELINEILDLSKIEAGQLRVKKVRCSPWQIVEEVVALKKLQATQRNLELSVHYQYPLPETVHTDPMRLRQILVNLVGNAIKFTEQGSVRIGVRFAAGPPACVVFAVQDTGIGIGQDGLPKLFRPFSQIDSTLSRSRGGAGLGLAISKRLAVMLGGDITLESDPGRGSTFTVCIDPGAVEDVPMLSAALSTEVKDRMEGSHERFRGRVLVAEDTRANQYLIRRILEKVGLTVDLAENGRLAIEKAEASLTQQQPYDVVLMDIQMPEMDGLEATRRLRSGGWDRPIVALTAHAMEGDREVCLRAGCNGYLSKPIGRERLLELLKGYGLRNG
jgi:two-component system CheB/CheR fusion protein